MSERERFEAAVRAASKKRVWHFDLERIEADPDDTPEEAERVGEYAYYDTQAAWLLWQAARSGQAASGSSQGARSDDLKKLADVLPEFPPFPTWVEANDTRSLLSWAEQVRRDAFESGRACGLSVRGDMLGNLLARIHGDGGHYIDEHGLEKAFADGDAKVVELRSVVAAKAGQPEAPTAAALEQSGATYGIIDPDYGRAYTIARKLAWEEGYAIGLHGSFTRDLDLVAVPWVEKPCEPFHLVRRIVAATGLKLRSETPGAKPQGRLVWTLLFPSFGDPRFVDFSVIPPARSGAGSEEKPCT